MSDYLLYAPLLTSSQAQQQTIGVPGDFYPEEVIDALKEMGFLEMGKQYEFLDWPREKGRWSAPVCRLPGMVLHLTGRERDPWETVAVLYGAPAARGMRTRQLERQTARQRRHQMTASAWPPPVGLQLIGPGRLRAVAA